MGPRNMLVLNYVVEDEGDEDEGNEDENNGDDEDEDKDDEDAEDEGDESEDDDDAGEDDEDDIKKKAPQTMLLLKALEITSLYCNENRGRQRGRRRRK